jgi:tetratricopeptide (TPR) repeat protein
MLSKEIVISAPLAVMLYDRAFRLPNWSALMRPGEGRGYLYAALWIVAIGTFLFVAAGGRGEASGLSLGMTWPAYLYTQCWAIAHYLRLVAWPAPLAIDYGFDTIHGARGIPGFVLLSLFGALIIAAWTRTERYGWFAFAGSIFFMVLAPSSSFVPQALEVAAERRMYLVLAAVLVIAVAGLEWLRRRFAPTLEFRRFAIALGVTAAALGVGTAFRSWVYNSPVALWHSAVRAVPDNARARTQLGWALFNLPTPQLDSAETEFKLALAENSTCRTGCLEYATLLSTEKRYAEAVPLLDRHLAFEGGNFLAARLAALDLMHLGDFNRAIPYLERAVSLAPRESHIVVLGVAYLSAGRKDDAIKMFRYLASLDSGNGELFTLGARLEDGAANHPEALADLQEFAYYQARGWM